MSWWARLTDDRGHNEGEWNYTVNTNRMVDAAIADLLTDVLRGDGLPASWIDSLNGRRGPDGAAFIDEIIRRLEADPDRFRAMNPENGWGDYDSLLKVLCEMRDNVPYGWPTQWSAHS